VSRATAWHIILPVKGGGRAKTRLGLDVDRPALSLAMAMDCLDAVLRTGCVARALVVTDDPLSARAARSAGAVVVPQSDSRRGLAGAVDDGLALAHGPTGVLLADLPALTPDDLEAALQVVHRALGADRRAAFVPDAQGVGTVLLAGCTPADLVPRFGPDSAAAHERAGATRLDLLLPRLRRDVDTATDLAAAVRLGVGPRTAATLAGVQATMLRFDPATGAGSVVTDDGVELDLAPDALHGSGLRHLRPGQRVTCERVVDAPGSVTRVHLHGIGDDRA
jgi:2-phospho-L-lactate guanylyltransferase